MTKKEFDKLADKEKRSKASEALAHLAVRKILMPFMFDDENIEILEIIVGKYMNGELVERR